MTPSQQDIEKARGIAFENLPHVKVLRELPPGSIKAIARGCLCDPMENWDGAGQYGFGQRFDIHSSCLIHITATRKDTQ